MDTEIAKSLPEELHTALQHWHDQHDDAMLADFRVVIDARRESGFSPGEAIQAVIEDGLRQLARTNPDDARLLRLRYIEAIPMRLVAQRLHRAPASAYRDQQRAIENLAEIICRQEMSACSLHEAKQLSRFEQPTYSRLFGVDDFLAELRTTLEQPGPPWLVLVEGIGGIGKTALADVLARDIVERSSFSEVGWITARRQRLGLHGRITRSSAPSLTVAGLLEQLALQLLGDISLPSPLTVDAVTPMLQERLRADPHLIVIDNLETLADVAALIPTVRSLLNPGKFLLTSRRSLPAEPDVYHLAVPQLARSPTLALVRHEAMLRNLPAVAAAGEAELAPIYDTVGGNPLALRLVVGQLRTHSLSRVIESLKTAQGRGIDALYTFIYRRAWEDLDDPARRAFLATPFVPPGGSTFEHLAAISGLSPAALQDALEVLIGFNLVDRLGEGIDDARYTIHSLTRTFLLEQVVKWQ